MSFRNFKHLYLIHTLSVKALYNGFCCESGKLLSLHGGSLEITLTVPLNENLCAEVGITEWPGLVRTDLAKGQII